MRRGGRLSAVVALVATLALAVSGCSIFGASWTPPPATDPDVSGVSDELLGYYDQHVDWQACDEGRFDCAHVRVPRDWADPAAAGIELAVIRQRAGDGAPLGSLLVNPGGPGVSGVDRVRMSAETMVGEELAAAYDVVGFDPRGVGESTAVDCYDTAGLDAYLYGVPDAERGTPGWQQELTARETAFAQACEANSDGLLPFISTANAARDLDVLRAVLGESSLDYLGFSWGTALGARYAELYPERVGRMVLDGALDPTVSAPELSVGQMAGFQRSLEAFLTDCVGFDDCPFRGTLDDAEADLETLFATVDARPVEALDGRELGADTLMTAMLSALYSPATWPYLRTALSGVRDGDPGAAYTLADLYNERQGGDYLGNSSEAFPAYTCMDYPRATEEEDAAALAELQTVAPLAAEYLVAPDLCAVWPSPPTGVNAAVSAAGAAPILVIGSTGDPATPYEWAVSLADQLQSGVLVTRVGEGHTGFNQGDACVDDAVTAYFVEGVVPASDLRCD